jgi:hypothetical protein
MQQAPRVRTLYGLDYMIYVEGDINFCGAASAKLTVAKYTTGTFA